MYIALDIMDKTAGRAEFIIAKVMYRTEAFIPLIPQLPKKTILKHTLSGGNVFMDIF